MAISIFADKKITKIVQRKVAGALREILSDPDAGLVLSRRTAARLRKSYRSYKAGNVRPLAEVLKHHR